MSPEPAAEVEVPEPAADDVDAPVEMLTSEIPEPEENPADDDGGILYAKVDGPPDNWNQLAILNIETGEQVPDVLEVSADEGWVMVHVLSAKGHPMSKNDEVIKHRIEGNFKIVLRSELPEGTKTAEPVRLADVLGQDPKRHRTRQLALHRHR